MADSAYPHIPTTAGLVPSSWSWSRLDAVCSGVFDCPHSTPKLSERGPLMARTQDVRGGVFKVEQAAHVSEATYRERTARVEPRPGDLLYSREGTYFGDAAEVPRGVRVCLGQRMVLLRPEETRISSGYLRCWLNGPVLQRHIAGHRDGSVAERLNLPTIRALPVLVPSPSEQHGIAAVAGVLEEKIDLNRRMIVTLEEMARALFKSWFVAAALESVTVEAAIDHRILQIGDGYRAKNDELGPSGLPFVRVGDVRDGIVHAPSDHLVDARPAFAQTKVSNAGDVLFTSKGTLGRFMLVRPTTHQFVYSPQMCFWRSLDHGRLDPHYLYYWMQSRRFLEQVDRVRGQNDMVDFVSLREQRRMVLDMPEPDALVALVKVLEPLEARVDAARRESVTLAQLRDYLLPKLLSGEVRVRDAEKIFAGAT